MSHTPGPWTWSGSHDDYDALRGADNYVLMAVWHNDSTAGIGCENEADARLIAAAPDLLRELKHLVRLLEPALNNGASVPGLATCNGALLAIAAAEHVDSPGVK